METQDGFILGVYNYCDRWCERCSLASRCRVYSNQLQMTLDNSAPRGQVAPGLAPALRSLGAVVALFEEALPEEMLSGEPGPGACSPDADPAEFTRPELDPADKALQARVEALGTRFWNWIAPENRADDPAVKDAAEVLQHFALFIVPKVNRALTGRKDGEEDGMLSDALGSAKVAELALDRLGDAWLQLAERGAISVLEAAPVLAELQSITAALEQRFPRARDFVRPGFDEPDALALLEWRERG
jgi:hypothetical protein